MGTFGRRLFLLILCIFFPRKTAPRGHFLRTESRKKCITEEWYVCHINTRLIETDVRDADFV